MDDLITKEQVEYLLNMDLKGKRKAMLLLEGEISDITGGLFDDMANLTCDNFFSYGQRQEIRAEIQQKLDALSQVADTILDFKKENSGK